MQKKKKREKIFLLHMAWYHFTCSAEPWAETILAFTGFLFTNSHSSIPIWRVLLPDCWLNVSLVERLIGGHPLRVVNWVPREESYQHNRNLFSDIQYVIFYQDNLPLSFEKGSLQLCLRRLKIRVSVKQTMKHSGNLALQATGGGWGVFERETINTE